MSKSVSVDGTFVSAEQAEMLIKAHAKDGVSESEIYAEMKKMGLAIRKKEQPQAKAKQQPLEKTIFDNVQNKLNILKMENLYQFLSVAQTANESSIRTAADRLQADWRVKKSDAEKAAADKVLSFVSQLLLLPDRRAQYDYSLRLQLYEPFLDNIRLAAVGRVIAPDQVENLLKDAAEYGIPGSEALELISEIAAKNNAIVQVATTQTLDRDSQICGACRATNTRNRECCARCQAYLKISCPKCGTSTSTDAMVCTNTTCGLTMDKMLSFVFDIERAQSALQVKHLARATEIIKNATFVYGTKNEVLSKLSQQVALLNSECKKDLDDAESKFKSGHVSAADLLLAKVSAKDISIERASHLKVKIDAAIEQIKLHLAKATSLGQLGNSDGAERELVAATLIGSDFPDLVQTLRRYPPQSPHTARIQRTDQGARLSWLPSKSHGISGYRIVRKLSGVPTSINDGDCFDVDGISFDDLKAPIGELLFYAVYSLRGDSWSTQGLQFDSITIASEVINLEVRPGNKNISFTWTPPTKKANIVIVRNMAQTPANMTDGIVLPVNGSSAFDSNLENGKICFYRIFSTFMVPGKGLIVSDGIPVSTRPEPEPDAVTAFTYSLEANSIRIVWSQPASGQVIVVKSQKRPEAAMGSTIPKDKIDQLGAVLSKAGATEAIDSNPGNSSYYTLITVGSGLAIVGFSQLVAKVTDVSGVRIEANADTIQAFWKWPDGVTVCGLAWRKDEYPRGMSDTVAKSMTVTKSEYSRQGRVTLAVRSGEECYLIVYSGITTPDGDFFATGTSPSARAHHHSEKKQSVRYSVKKTLLGKKSLVFQSSKAGIMHGVVFVAKAMALPIDVADGQIVASIPSIQLTPEGTRIDFPVAPKGFFIKAFFDDPHEYDRYLLDHPKMEELRSG